MMKQGTQSDTGEGARVDSDWLIRELRDAANLCDWREAKHKTVLRAAINRIEMQALQLTEWLATVGKCEQSGCQNKRTRVVTGNLSPLGEITVELCDSCCATIPGTDLPHASVVRMMSGIRNGVSDG